MAAINGIGFIFGPIIGSLLSIFGIMIPFIGVGIISILNGLMALWLLPRKNKKASKNPQQKREGFSIRAWGKLVLEANILPFLIGTFVYSMSDSSSTSTLAYFIVGHLHSTQAITGWAFAVNGGIGAMVQITLLSRFYARFGESDHFGLSSDRDRGLFFKGFRAF